ncbi:hypothetical protein ACVS9Z_003393 [Cronobacter dublinensis]|nr:hypothetical protein [Cronobacter dublinensis]
MPVIEPAAAPRKLPRQARSRALVEAIIEATARIFERAGPAACTTNAWDVIALAQGMIAMAARRSESDAPTLARRIERAVFGYLGWPVPDAGGF